MRDMKNEFEYIAKESNCELSPTRKNIEWLNQLETMTGKKHGYSHIIDAPLPNIETLLPSPSETCPHVRTATLKAGDFFFN